MKPEESTQLNTLYANLLVDIQLEQPLEKSLVRLVKWRDGAINDKLEEAAAELDKLGRGASAELVRAMKVK